MSIAAVVSCAPIAEPKPVAPWVKTTAGWSFVAGAGIGGGAAGYYGAKKLFGKKMPSKKQTADSIVNKGPVATAVASAVPEPSLSLPELSKEPAGQPIPEDLASFLQASRAPAPKTPIEEATAKAISSSTFPDLRTVLQPRIPADAAPEKVAPVADAALEKVAPVVDAAPEKVTPAV